MAEAEQKVDTACKKMLANQIMESYHFELTEA
jgi:phosphoribosylformylglycinamidine (FGAM) synthase PurS component